VLLNVDTGESWRPPVPGYPECSFSQPHGKYLMVSDYSSAYTIWDVSTQKEFTRGEAPQELQRSRFGPKAGSVISSEFRTEGRQKVATGYHLQWNLFDEQQQTEIDLPPNTPNLRFGPQGGRYATYNDRDFREVVICDYATRKEIWRVEFDPDRYFNPGPDNFRFSPDESLLVIPQPAGDLKLYHIDTREIVKFRGHEIQARGIAFRPDGGEMVSGGDSLKFWNPFTPPAAYTFRAHTGGVSVEFSPDGETLATRGSDEVIKLWNVPSFGLKRTINWDVDGTPKFLVFSLDGDTLAVASPSDVRLWNLGDGRPPEGFESQYQPIESLQFFRDANHLLIGDRQGASLMLGDGTLKQRVDFQHKGLVYEACPSPDGNWIAMGGLRGILQRTNLQTGKSKAIGQHAISIIGIAFSRDSSLVACCGWDNKVTIYDVESGEQTAVLRGHTRQVSGCAFMPDGTRIVSIGRDRTLRIWHVESQRTLLTLRSDTDDSFASFAIHPNGNMIVAGTSDGRVRVWERNRPSRGVVTERRLINQATR